MNKQTTTEQKETYISNPFKLIFKGFGDLFNYNQTMAIIILVVTLFNSFSGLGGPGDLGSTSGSDTPSRDVMIIVGIIVAVVILLIMPIAIFLSTMFKGIVAYTALQTHKKVTVNFGDTFKLVLKRFWTILWISVVVGFKVFGGLLLFIIPGVRAYLRYRMVYMFVFDENANAKTAIQKSKALTKDHLIEVFGMTTASGIIPFVSGVMEAGGYTIMYPQLKQLKASNAPKPPVHWLNYLGFILLGVLAFLIAGVALMIAAIVS